MATSSTSSTPGHDLLDILGQIEHTDLPILCNTMKQALEPTSDFTNVFQQGSRMGRMADAGSHVFQTIKDTADNIRSQIGGRDSENGISLVLSNVLEQVGKSHYLATALSLTAAAMKSYRAYSNNKALCIDLLNSMVELVDALKNLPQDLQSSDEMYLKEISRVIILGALKMQSMSKGSKAKRFIFSLINEQDLKNIQQKLRDVFQSLSLRVSNSILSNLNRDQYHNIVPSKPEAVGIDATIEDVVKEVGIGKLRSQCICICLHGMGGAGKSLIVDAVYHKLMEDGKLKGYKHCRLELDFQEDKETMKKRQKQLFEMLTGQKCPKIGNLKDGKEIICRGMNKLKKQKEPVFLLLDNLLQQSDVGHLVLDGSMYDPRSAFVVTTRDQGISHELEMLKLNVVKKHVLPLKEDESRLLLYRSMGCDQQDVDESLRTAYEKKLVKTCDGLPLALKLVGGYIGAEGQNEQDVWERAVNSLKEGTFMTAENSMDMRTSLRFSIESLNPDLKKSFLDVVSFYNGRKWTFDFQCVIGKQELQWLEKRHLIQRNFDTTFGWHYDPITQTTTKTTMRVKVHDILLGLGLNILKNDLTPRSITDLTEFDSFSVDFDNSCKIRGIWLKKQQQTLPANILCQMPDIRFLVNVKVEGKCRKELKGLKKCSLDGIVGSSMPLALMKATDLRSLEVELLNMAGEKLPNNMKILSLISSPGIQNLEQFKSKNLEFLRLDGCPELESMEGIEHLRCLKHLIISNCEKLREVVVRESSLTALESLQISNCSNLEHVKFNMDSAKLRCIIIKRCEKLKELPSGYFGMHHLEVTGCDNITALPQQFNCQQDLRYLSLEDCSSLSHLPDGFLSDFPKLQELCLDGCQGLTSLPDLQQHHSHSPLNRISLVNCPNLPHLPDGFFVAFPNLENLYLSGCQGLTSFPDLQQHHSHPSLKLISLKNCSNLPHLPDGLFVAFPKLQELYLSGCQGLTSFPALQQHHSHSHPSLKVISLINCSNVLHLPDSFFVAFPNLEYLYLDGCQGLTSFPDFQQHHSHTSLKYISLRNCSNLPHLPDGFFVAFPNLEYLNLDGCQGLTSFPDFQQHHSHSSLKYISLRNCSNLPHLPDGFFVAFPNLENLNLDGCQGLTSFPDFQQHHSHSSLKYISLRNCSNLPHLPDGFFVAFPNLENLNLYGCQGLASFPALQQHHSHPSLKLISLKNCSNLPHLPDGFFVAFPNLEKLYLDGCQGLTSLPTPQQHYFHSSLEVLSLVNCSNLSQLPDGFRSAFPNLQIWN